MFSKSFFAVLVILSELQDSEVLGYDCIKRPKVRYPFCQDRNEARKGHTMCLGGIHQHLMNDTVRHELSNLHETLRTNVNPPAADMIRMEHSKLLEKEAQIWAEQCKLAHDKDELRFLADRYTVGQNIAVGSSVLNWTRVLEDWGNEKTKFKYGGPNNVLAVRNYAQIIWAKSYLFGCGVSKCGSKYFYVCNYAPSMNVSEISTPYTTSASSTWCDSCPGRCDNVTARLCDCRGKLCLNGGQINLINCTCDCIKGVHTYDSQYCELICDPNGDDPLCGKPPFENTTCGKRPLTDYHCPWMCDICPYAGVNYTESSVLLPWERGLPVCTTSTTSTTTTTTAMTRNTLTTGVSMTTTPRTTSGTTTTRIISTAPKLKNSHNSAGKQDITTFLYLLLYFTLIVT